MREGVGVTAGPLARMKYRAYGENPYERNIMNLTLEDLCARRDLACDVLNRLETLLVDATTLAEVQDLLARRDAAIATYELNRREIDDFFTVVPKPNFIRRIFTK